VARSEKGEREQSDSASVRAPRAAGSSRERQNQPAGRAESAPKERTGLVQFIRECWAELGRVQWPTRHQLWQATAVVLVVCLVMGVYIAALDSLLQQASAWLIDKYAEY